MSYCKHNLLKYVVTVVGVEVVAYSSPTTDITTVESGLLISDQCYYEYNTAYRDISEVA